ncbi:MAG: flagellar hook-length control protein FliK [Desulfitobacteriaceae bacterium]
MVSINVLPASGKPLAKEGSPSESKGDALDGQNKAAAQFAAILSGWIPMLGAGGQSSGDVTPGFKGDSSKISGDSTQSAGSATTETTLQKLWAEFANWPVFQGNFPAGKEANSGSVDGQSRVDPALSGISAASGAADGDPSSVLSALLAKIGDERTGMMPLNSQGMIPTMTELDQYRVIIAELLKDLAGNMKNLPLQTEKVQGVIDGRLAVLQAIDGKTSVTQSLETGLSSASVNNHLDEAKNSNAIISGWRQEQPGQMVAKPASTVGLPNAEVSKVYGTPAVVSSAGQDPISLVQHTVLPMIKDGTVSSNGVTDGTGVAFSTEKFMPSAQAGPWNEKGQSNDPKDQNSNNAGHDGQVELTDKKGTVLPFNMTDSGLSIYKGDSAQPIPVQERAVSLPVWQQVAASVNTYLQDKRPEVRALEIQLNPAELGKIQIVLHWEGDQVHMQVQASEVTTGNILQNHMQDLRQALANAGISCGMLQMGAGGEQRRNSWQNGFNSPKFSKNGSPGEGQDLVQEISYLSQAIQGEHRLNVTA